MEEHRQEAPAGRGDRRHTVSDHVRELHNHIGALRPRHLADERSDDEHHEQTGHARAPSGRTGVLRVGRACVGRALPLEHELPQNGVDAHTMATNPSTTAVTLPGTPSHNGQKNAKSTMIAATANAVTENVDDETAPLPGRQASAMSTT